VSEGTRKKFKNCPAGQAKGQARLFQGRPGLPGHPLATPLGLAYGILTNKQ